MAKLKRFFFHYNKPESKKAGKPIISVHYDKTCFFVENIICDVATTGKINKRQPLFVITGKCSSFTIENNVARIQ